MNMDLILRKAINILFVSNPTGTSLGILFGVILHSFLVLLSPLFVGSDIVDIKSITPFHLIAFGVFLINFPAYLRRDRVDSSIEHAYQFIDKMAKEGKLSKIECVQSYRKLQMQVLKNVTLKSDDLKLASIVKEVNSFHDNSKTK